MVDLTNYSTKNVTTSAYVEIDSGISSSCSLITIVDTSTQLMKIASGSAGNEVDFCIFQGNGNPVQISKYLASGTRLSLKAISGNATSGYNGVSLF